MAIVFGRASRQYYPSNQVFDLREELSNLLYGDQSNPGIGQQVLIRRMTEKTCVCYDPLRGSPNASCQRCLGEGNLWIETMNTCYLARAFGSVQDPSNVISRQNFIAPYGYSGEDRAVAYFEAKAFPDYERYTIPTITSLDSLFELKIDLDGRLVRPVIRTQKWNIKSLLPHRGDDGAVIYVEAGLEREYA